MRIEKINIAKYGKFSGFSLEFDSYSLITGENESGKSTILSFIYFMLYGESGIVYEDGGAAGSMTVRCGEEKYRIERVLDGGGERCSVLNIVDGKKCFEGLIPGEALLGISGDEFRSMCYLDQQSGRELGSGAIRDAAGSLIVSQDEKNSIKRIIRTLEDGKMRLEDEKLYPLEKEKSEAEESLSEILLDASSATELDGRLKEVESRIKSNERRLDLLSKLTESYAVRLKRKLSAEIEILREEYEESARLCADFREKNQRDGFFPDRAFLENLENLSNNISGCDRRIAELNDMIRAADPNYMSGRFPSSVGIHRHGYLLIIGIILCTLAIPAFLLTLFFFSVNAIYAVISAVGTLLIGIGAALCLRLYFDAGRELTESLAESDPLSENESPSELDLLIGERNENENMRSAYSMKLCEQFSRWGDNLDAVLLDLSALLCDYDKLVSRTSYLKAELDEDEKQLDELKSAVPSNETDVPLPQDFDAQKAGREYEFISKAKDALIIKKEELEAQLEGAGDIESPAGVAEKIYILEEELKEARLFRSAYELAISEMYSTAIDLDDSKLPKLLSKASDYIAKFTGGRYTGIGIAHEKRIVLLSSGRQVEVSRVSGAMLDIIYLCIRLAIVALTPVKSSLPIILDDYLTRLDDARLETVTRYLGDMSFGGTQVIITATEGRSEDLYGFGVKVFNI